MSWTDIFRSRYVRFLEGELNSERTKHAEELERLKKTHAEELERAIKETNRAWGEVDRLRQYLIPNMPIADRSPQTTEAPAKEVEEVPHGTPFQRLLRKSYLEQEAAAKAAEKPKETEKQNAASN